ncbi:hypothetical protein CYY_007155 [Polysphondylium violaceum]|uniref:Leucine-rich repeat-containing protein n=1 Tax=Polysphondylium violaceum TaxID=133409 RepID=A0A8J4PPZ8_9MYCE|nr:hypothetical protein CYY_007155 [Polysphondylium violaceum]
MGKDQQQQISDRLDLAYRDITEINPQIVQRFGPYVKELDLSNNNLEKDLTILEGFTSLHTLVLDGNRVTSHTLFPIMPKVHTLWVNSNLIANLSIFMDRVVDCFPNVRTLSMLKNEACPNFFNGHSLREYKDYRLYVVHRLRNLQILDSTPVNDEERREAVKVYGSLTNITTSGVVNVKVELPAQSDYIEDDPKKKREEAVQKQEQDKEQRRLERKERKEKRILKREAKAEKKLQKDMAIGANPTPTTTVKQEKKEKDEDDFTDEEGEQDVVVENNVNKNNSGNDDNNGISALPTFSSEQAPVASVLPPIPPKLSSFEPVDNADDEANTVESASDHSDLPVYNPNKTTPPPPPSIKHEDDDDDDSDWSSDQELDSDQEVVLSQLTIDQYQYEDDDSSDDDNDDENNYIRTHVPVPKRK